MPPLKTPKSSLTTPRPPKTPKSAKAPAAIATKAKRPRNPTKTVQSKKQKIVEISEPQKPAQKKARRKQDAPATMLDDVDVGALMAQHTRARATGKISLEVMKAESNGDVVDISEICERAHRAETTTGVAIDDLRFSKRAVQFTQMLADKIFASKARDVFNMNQSTNKQTVTMQTIWAERNYCNQSNPRFSAASASITTGMPQTMIEDVLLAAQGTDSSWLQCVSSHEKLQDKPDDLVDIAMSEYGENGPWTTI